MPRSNFAGSFVLFYDYMRLDVIGNLDALGDLLAFARDNDLAEPITYLLDHLNGEERHLPLTTESQRIWSDLKEGGIDALERSDNFIESSWTWPDEPSQLVSELENRAAAGLGIVLFKSQPLGISYKAAASSRLDPRWNHRYEFPGSRICVSCNLKGGPGGQIETLLGLEVDRPSQYSGTGGSSSCDVEPCKQAQLNERCLKYAKDAGKSENWRVIVSAKDQVNITTYRIAGSIMGTYRFGL